jgi:HPt (histidine-containing phosphotransfer) domain-containing protein
MSRMCPDAERSEPAGAIIRCQTGVAKPGSIDFAHLARMTVGEKALEVEVLVLFDRQAALVLAHMKRPLAPEAAAACAHTIGGSARGVGAWNVAAAAEQVELAARSADAAEIAPALQQLITAINEARAAIKALLIAKQGAS